MLVDQLEQLIFEVVTKHELRKHAQQGDINFHKRIDDYEQSRKPDFHGLNFAARIVRLEKLEKSNVGRGKAIEAASGVELRDLTPKEKRAARDLAHEQLKPTPRPRPRLVGKKELVDALSRALRIKTGAKRHSGAAKDVIKAALDYYRYSASPETIATYLKTLKHFLIL